MVTAGGLPPLPGAWSAAGTRLRTARPSLPAPARPAPQLVGSTFPHSPGEREAEPWTSAASPGTALPHAPPTPAPEAAARDPRQGAGPGGQDKVTHWESAAARGAHRLAAPQPSARSALRGPAEGAGSRPASAPPGTAAAAATTADFLARSKLWPRLHFSTAPAAFPGASAGAEPPNPTRTWANRL